MFLPTGEKVNRSGRYHAAAFNASKKPLKDTKTRLEVAKRYGWDWEKAGLGAWDFQVQKSYVAWINIKALLNSTGNYIHYAVMNPNGKECEKE